MTDVLIRRLYGLVTRLLMAPVFGYFCWRGIREPAYRQGWRERLGQAGRMEPGAIWIHAASVGEVSVIEPLVDALCTRYPGRPLLLTTMTPTGRARAADRLAGRVTLRYVPLDTPGATRRFVHGACPCLAIFAETELWPNLIAATTDAGVPLVMVNASVSASSAARYARWPMGSLVRSTLGRINRVGASSPAHAQRLQALGVPRARIKVTGNLKYDVVVPPGADYEAGKALRQALGADERPVWVAASTHAGEEVLLLEALRRVRRAYPDTLLVIAPRHPQRFDAVAALLEHAGLVFARRSRSASGISRAAVLLADTLGEVPMFFAGADVAFVGGSLIPGIGGHNVIEAAASRLPLCVGPHIAEWQEIVDGLVACGAARVCATPGALAEQIGQWLDAPLAARTAGRAGADHVSGQRGALARSLQLIAAVLEP